MKAKHANKHHVKTLKAHKKGKHVKAVNAHKHKQE